MSALNRTPADLNQLQASKFLISFARIPTVQYFCQQVNLPGMSMSDASFNTPFKDLKSSGNKLMYDELDMEFLVDETLTGWQEMHAWFRSMAAPTDFFERVRLAQIQNSFVENANKRPYSDATLIVLNNLNIPTIRVQFYNCFPVSLSGIKFDVTQGADDVLTSSASFYFDSFEFVPV